MASVAAVLASLMLGILALFQVLLVLGAPWGRFALASGSKPERAVMAPLAAVLCGLCAVVALS